MSVWKYAAPPGEKESAMQKRLAHLILLFGLFLLAACSSPTTTSTTTNTPPAATVTPVPKPATLYYSSYDSASSQMTVSALDGASGKQRWSYTVSADAGVTPTLADGVVYVAASTGLIALDASTGSMRWGNPAFANAQVVDAANGVLYANVFSSTSSQAATTSLDAINASDGSLRWSYQFTNGEGDVLADGVIYGSDTQTPFGTPTSPNGTVLVAMNASDGSVKWKSAQEDGYLTPQSVANGLVYAYNSFPMGGPVTIEARKISDGSVAWRFPSSGGHATYLGLANNVLYAQSDDGSSDLTQNKLYALNATTGAVIWRSEVTSSPLLVATLVQQVIYVGYANDNSLAALNAVDGKQRWQAQLGAPSGSNSVTAQVLVRAVEDGTAYLVYPDGFAALNASTGAIKWKMPDSSEHTIVAVRNGVVYGTSDTGDSGGKLIARSASTGAVLWSQDVGGLVGDPIVG